MLSLIFLIRFANLRKYDLQQIVNGYTLTAPEFRLRVSTTLSSLRRTTERCAAYVLADSSQEEPQGSIIVSDNTY